MKKSIKDLDDLKNYIEIEKVTKDDVLIFKIDIDMFSGDSSIDQIVSPIIKEANTVLEEKEIKAIFIPYYNGLKLEILPSESELLKVYDIQQGTLGFRDGFLKGLSDFDNNIEYCDETNSKYAIYVESYKQGYKKAHEFKKDNK